MAEKTDFINSNRKVDSDIFLSYMKTPKVFEGVYIFLDIAHELELGKNISLLKAVFCH